LLGSTNAPTEAIVRSVPGVPAGLLVLTVGYGWSWPGKSEHELPSAPYALTSDRLPAWFRIPFRGTWSLERDRDLALTAPTWNEAELPEHTLSELEKLNRPSPEPYVTSLPQQDPLHQWGMNIDLSRCIGCNACLIACQAENNIPTVGRTEVARGRSMHWIRIDRYFHTTSPGAHLLQPYPVACQQCEKAPCESVCPVNATVHSSEGINAMTYARCWGTRYCAANCPYRARRFNFFDYAKQSEEETKALRNPNVTVRVRGVMEKCSYCVQRIQEAKIKKKAEGAQRLGSSVDMVLTDDDLRLPEGSVQTACQEACPMAAISFGNLLANGRVNALRQSPRSVTALAELGTRPRTTYLGRVLNPNPKMLA
jgi:molybdopterin-containing oxidoreductase family iron-sulfur binding subunit